MPPTPVASSNSAKTQTPQLPPEPRFWVRYSPHHEFPLSAVGSFVLHTLAGALLVFVAIQWFAARHRESESLPMEMLPAGGGSHPDGAGEGPGDGIVNPNKEDVGKPPDKFDSNVTASEDLALVKADPLEIPEIRERLIDADPSEALQGFSKLAKDVNSQKEARKIFQGLAAGKGKGGPGSGGGRGAGRGTGEGDMEGPGKQNLSVRQRRVLRWTMIFNTANGDDYKRQLSALGAILAIPVPQGGYQVIRDLMKQPAVGEVEDLAQIKRIFWIDNKPDSVAALARALGLRYTPPNLVAFFPVELEEELLRKEKQFRGRSEDEIKETVFRVVRQGGSYTPIVESQRSRR